MLLKIDKPLASVNWLMQHINNENLIVLDATLPKVTAKQNDISEKKMQIKNALFFDIKKEFSNINAPFPNTVLSPKEFEIKAQKLGVNNNSCIVVYDDLGMYSSPRVWWLFQLMGFTNITVLNGGLPEWKLKGYPVEKPKINQFKKGNFTAKFSSKKIKYTKDVLSAINDDKIVIADARSRA